MKVLAAYGPLAASSITSIRAAGPSIELTYEPGRNMAAATALLADDTEVAFMNGLPLSVPPSRRLRWVQIASAGVDTYKALAGLERPGHPRDHGERDRVEQHRRVRARDDADPRPPAGARHGGEERPRVAGGGRGLRAPGGAGAARPDPRPDRVRRRRPATGLVRSRAGDAGPRRSRQRPSAAAVVSAAGARVRR